MSRWLAALAHNVLVALKRLALLAEALSAQPKRLRFCACIRRGV